MSDIDAGICRVERYKALVSGAEPVPGGNDASDPIWSSDLRTLDFVQSGDIRSVTISESGGALVPGPVREGLVSLEPGDQVLGSGRVDAPLPRIREARPAGFPESEAQVVTNRRWTVVVVLSEFGR